MNGLRRSLAVAAVLVACSTGGDDPARLVGVWRSDTPPATLELVGRSFRLESGTLTKRGTVERTPFRLAFVLEETSSPAFNLYCRERADVYDWRIEDERLVLRAVGRPCDRAARAVLVAGTWRRLE